jgi:hypothetical protein
MKRRRRVWRWVFAVVALGVAATLVPDTPIYLPNWFVRTGQHDGRSTRAWIKDLDDPDARVRQKAIFALGAIGPGATHSVPALAAILAEDPDGETRSAAALALSKMAPASRAAVAELAGALADVELPVRMNAALALLRLGEEARPAVPALLKALEDRSNQTDLETFWSTIQEVVVAGLGRASSGTAEAVPALTRALERAQTEEMRVATARALGVIGPPARPAVPLLRLMLKDEDNEVRQTAETALENIEGKPVENRDRASAAGNPEEKELPEAERKYIWNIEHHGNLLVKDGFGPLAGALKGADAAALARLLADDFTGADLQKPRRVRAAGYAEVERLEDAGHAPIPLSRDAFVARLLGFRKVFAAAAPEVKFALMTLGPKKRGQLDGAWAGTAQLRLYGEHAKGAPAEIVVYLRYEVARPTRETLARPGWLRSAAVQQVTTARSPRYLFAEVARQRGLDASRLHDNWNSLPFRATTGGVYVCDFDRDGILDVLITDVNGCSLYQGRAGGTFVDVTDRYGLPRHPSGFPVAAWVDIDGDGWEDLILAGKVYRNEAGKRFTDYTQRCNLRLPRDVTAMVVADYDRDGKLDLYVTRKGRLRGRSWLDGKSGDRRGNYLFRNKGNWQFEDVTRASGTGGGHRSTFTAAWLDVNNDGWPDLHIINEFGDGVLLVNQRNGTFAPQALAKRPADFGSMGLAVGDVDNDGNIDIFCANMYSKAGTRVMGNLAEDAYPPAIMEKLRRFVAGSQLHLNKGALKFEQVGQKMQVAPVGWAYGACLADLDNDGFLDLYATAGFVSRDRNEPDG